MVPVIRQEIVVSAAPDAVWDAWTTVEGARSFFAPEARIALELFGAYEMLFDLEAPVGSQGGEGCRVLAFVPGELLSFTWNAPPDLGAVRDTPTFVVVRLVAEGFQTRVILEHGGFGAGAAWEAVRAYFVRAWGIVLGRLAYRFAVGPIDWEHPWRPG